MAGEAPTDFVLKAYLTESDARTDSNPLQVTTNSPEITNGDQAAGYNFFTHEKYFFRIEANDLVSEFYIDWDDGESSNPEKDANYTLIKCEPPQAIGITSHTFTRDKPHYPKIRVKSPEGYLSKYYMPSVQGSGSSTAFNNLDGIDVIVGQTLPESGRNDRYRFETDTGSGERIPKFCPTPKPPVGILKSDKKTVYSGINNELFRLGDRQSITITDCDMASGVGTVTHTEEIELNTGDIIVLNLSNDTYDETAYIADIQTANRFTYNSTLRHTDGNDIPDQTNMTGTGHVTTFRGCQVKLVANPTVEATRTGVEVEVTYRTSGKLPATLNSGSRTGDRGKIRKQTLSFGGDVNLSQGCIEVLRIELLDLKEASSASDTNYLGAGERIGLQITDANDGLVHQVYKWVGEVSLGCPVVDINNPKFSVTYDATESYARHPEGTIDYYNFDAGHEYWLSHGVGNTDVIQTHSSTNVTDELNGLKGDGLRNETGLYKTSYNFIPGFEYLDEDNRWLTKQILARVQVTQSDAAIFASDDTSATYKKSPIEHWVNEAGTATPQDTNGSSIDYSSTREGVAGYGWTSDMLSSNYLALKTAMDADSWVGTNTTSLGTSTNLETLNRTLPTGPNSINGVLFGTDKVSSWLNRTAAAEITTLDDADSHNFLMMGFTKPKNSIHFNVKHMYDIMKSTDTATDGSDTDATKFMHTQCLPASTNSTPNVMALSTGSGGSIRQNTALNRIQAFYTAPFTVTPDGATNTGLAAYPAINITDLDISGIGSGSGDSGVTAGRYRHALATVTCSDTHGLSVGDEVFLNVQETITGTATSGDGRTLIDTSESKLNRPDGFYVNSRLTITSGTNSGKEFAVLDNDGSAYKLFIVDDGNDALTSAIDSTSVYSLTKDYSCSVVVSEITSTTAFKVNNFSMAYYGSDGRIFPTTNLDGTVERCHVWKPLALRDNTRLPHVLEYNSSDASDYGSGISESTSFHTSGCIEWDEPDDWVSCDPASIPDRFWPHNNFEAGGDNQASSAYPRRERIAFAHDVGPDVDGTSSGGERPLNVFDHYTMWNHEYEKYGLMFIMDSTAGVVDSADTATADRYRSMSVLQMFPVDNTHSQIVNVVDPMAVSLNDRAIAQSVSFTHKGKYVTIKDRVGMSDIRKISAAGGDVAFGGIDLLDKDGVNYTRALFNRYQRRNTPVYLDVTHTDSNVTRFYGKILDMSEDMPVGAQYPKFGLKMGVEYVMRIDGSSGKKIGSGPIPLGGENIDETRFIW